MSEERNSRITVVESVYHQHPTQDAEEFTTRFSRPLTTKEQPYFRVLCATEEWAALDVGWLRSCSILVIRNEEGLHQQRQPTDEQREEAALHVLELGTAGDPKMRWLIRPGESMRGCPNDAGLLYVRSQHGNTMFRVFITPE